MRTRKRLDKRQIFLCIFLIAVLLAYVVRMFQIQVLNAQAYVAQYNGLSTHTAVIKAPRGEILDCYGRPLAVNRDGYNIVFNSAYLDKETLNDTILLLMEELRGAQQAWVDNLPLEQNAPFGFSGSETAVSALRARLGLAHYATAENCFVQMVKRYSLEGMDTASQRALMGVRYSMEASDFSISIPYTFAEDISTELMTVIMESSFLYPGVEVQTAPFREYVDTAVAPHIIGTLGPIYAEEWEALKEKGYSYNDKVGKSGIEKAAEDDLRGIDGEITYTVDAKGSILSSEVTKQPVPGNTVMLSIDKSLQQAAQTALQTMVANQPKGVKLTGAAAVVVNVKTGGILASANYPSYDMQAYAEDYETLEADPGKPLFDRAFQGLYPPGSTFKPAVAIGTLQEGTVTAADSVFCKRRYTHYESPQPSCMQYHRSVNIISAIAKSCNYFFFDVGRRLGIEKMNKYCAELGFGQYTGVEITERKGTLAGPDYSASVNQIWYDGNTLSAAIGQSDNAVTPLQLAMYTATIANNGTRYKATLIRKVCSYDMETTVREQQPVVLNGSSASAETFSIVKQGMREVVLSGTGRFLFDRYPVSIAGKSGTAEAGDGLGDHSLYIMFAPFDDPEIAIAVVAEHGEQGVTSGSVTKAILNAYFFPQQPAAGSSGAGGVS